MTLMEFLILGLFIGVPGVVWLIGADGRIHAELKIIITLVVWMTLIVGWVTGYAS